MAAMRDYYLNSTRELGVADSHTRWVTDKTPHNAIHVGLLALLFPQSPIIHISRHPLNSCLSAYFSNFKVGTPLHFQPGEYRTTLQTVHGNAGPLPEHRHRVYGNTL